MRNWWARCNRVHDKKIRSGRMHARWGGSS